MKLTIVEQGWIDFVGRHRIDPMDAAAYTAFMAGFEAGQKKAEGAAPVKVPSRKAANAAPTPRPETVAKEVWEAWLQLRKAKRAPVSALVVAMMIREAEAADISLEDAFLYCVERGWAAFRADWYLGSTVRRPQSFAQQDAALRRQRYEEMTGRRWGQEIEHDATSGD